MSFSRSPRRTDLTLRVSGIALAGALALAASPAFAQDAGATDPAAQPASAQDDNTGGGDIVVTGFRASLRSAISAKRNATQIIESLSAEDVGKLPDVSITDSLARLPGVTAQSNSGRATYLSIRGFGPDFTTATLNGRVVATIDDNRRFQYDQFPGDLFSRIDVIKTPSADLMNQGLAGTVNLMTIDPLAAKSTLAIKLEGQVNGKGKLNPDSTNKGYNGSIVFVDSFADNTIGISLGGSAISSPIQTQGYGTWGYAGGNGSPYILGGAKWYDATNVLKRQSGFGHLVWRPSDGFETSIDGLYTRSTTREYWRGVEMPLAYGGGVALTSASASGDWLTSATFDPTWPVQRNNFNTRNADTWAVGWNAKAALSDTIRFVIDAGYSRGHRHDNAIETYSGTSYNRAGTSQISTITLQPNGTYALNTNLDYTDLSTMVLTDPQGWGYYSTPAFSGPVPQTGYINEPDFTDTVKTLRGQFEGDINAGILKKWKIGAYYSDEKKVNAFTGFYLVPPGGANSLAIPSSIVIGAVSPFELSGSKVLAYDIDAAVNLLDSFRNMQSNETTKQWWVRERILTGFAQLDFDGDVSGHRISGNIGGQVIRTVQDSSGYAAINTDLIAPVYAKTKYTYFMPQATFNLEFTPSTILRMGFGRTLARARLTDENPSFTVSASAAPSSDTQFYNGQFTPLSGNGGNPILRPYFATYVDLSLEKYFANNQGKIALAGYYKDITNFVQTGKSYISDLSAFASQIPTGVFTPYTTMGWVTAPANTGRGYVQGFELSTVLPFSVATPVLDGFGVTGSVAFADSVIRFDNGSPVTLPGLSKWVAQAQLYFEKWGFAARASYSYRSDFLGEYQAYGGQPALKYTKGGSSLDAQIGYDFKSGALNGLSVYVQGRNLTNMPYMTYLNGDKRQIDIYEKYGPTYMAGLTFKFW